MMGECGAPGVEHSGDTDAGAEVLGVGGDDLHRVGGGTEQQVVNDGLVVGGDGADLGRNGEDDVEVADRQQVGLTLGKPGTRSSALALTWANPSQSDRSKRLISPNLSCKFGSKI